MYDNIGEKIKALTKIMTVIAICGCAIAFIVIAATDGNGLWAFLYCGGASLLIFLSSFFAYGFGELIDKVCDIENKFTSYSKTGAEVKDDKEKEQKLHSLLERGLISEEEYRNMISK